VRTQRALEDDDVGVGGDGVDNVPPVRAVEPERLQLALGGVVLDDVVDVGALGDQVTARVDQAIEAAAALIRGVGEDLHDAPR
jgi:hypothetical protein